MNLFKITMMALAITMFQSCGNKDEKTSDLEPLTQQEGKSSIESSSVNLLNDIEGFKDDKSVEAVVDLAKYFDGLNSSAKKSQGQLLFQSFLNDVVDVKSGKKQLTSLNEPLVMPEEDLDFKTYYESNKGEYTFNESTKEFEKTGSSAGMVFKVVYNGKTAKFELSNYTTTDYVGYTKGEILKSIAVSLVIDQLEVMKYTFNVDFYKYMPKSINTSYKLGAVEITALLNNSNNTVVSEDTEVKLYGKSIFSEEVSVTGDFKVLDNATNEEEFENASESVLKSILKADTKFVIGGIILNANANVKAILEGEDNLPNGDGKVKIEAEAKLINAN
ncbi:MAG: hypothetical protein KAG96_00745, partial [Ichthyobacteriaceae bacterium]|nr:hypothetical protein [Ichthyobacteriaceae bacterium]